MKEKIRQVLDGLGNDECMVLFNELPNEKGSMVKEILQTTIIKFPNNYQWLVNFALKHKLRLIDAYKWNILSALNENMADKWFEILQEYSNNLYYFNSPLIPSLLANIVESKDICSDESNKLKGDLFKLICNKDKCFIGLLCYKMFGEKSLQSPLLEKIEVLTKCLEDKILGNPDKYLPVIGRSTHTAVINSLNLIDKLWELDHPLMEKLKANTEHFFGEMVENAFLHKDYNNKIVIRAVELTLQMADDSWYKALFLVFNAINKYVYHSSQVAIEAIQILEAIFTWHNLIKLLGRDQFQTILNDDYLHFNGLFNLNQIKAVVNGEIPLESLSIKNSWLNHSIWDDIIN